MRWPKVLIISHGIRLLWLIRLQNDEIDESSKRV